MVYKFGNISDVASIPFAHEKACEICTQYARVLTTEYGEDRNIDTSDGGYILYATPGTSNEEIKAYFDHSKYTVEYVDVFGEVCSALYLLSNDYGVVIVMSVADAPMEIKKEMDEEE
jgi:hypothetical protein